MAGSNRLPVLAEEIRGCVHAYRHYRAKSVEFALLAGRHLIEAKAALRETAGHGSWLPWLETANVGERTAQRWMALAAAVEDGRLKSDTVTDLGIRASLERLREIDAEAAAAERKAFDERLLTRLRSVDHLGLDPVSALQYLLDRKNEEIEEERARLKALNDEIARLERKARDMDRIFREVPRDASGEEAQAVVDDVLARFFSVKRKEAA